MNIVLILLIFIALIIGISVLVHKSGKFSKPPPITQKSLSQAQQEANAPPNQYLPNPSWSKPIGYPPGGTGGQCLALTFLGGQYTPATPSYAILNSGNTRSWYTRQPNFDEYACLDVDQLFGYQISHECVNPSGNNAGSGCILTVPTVDKLTGTVKNAGEKVSLGTVEGVPVNGQGQTLYSQCTPANLGNNKNNTNYCLGSIGLVIPNFVPQASYDTNLNQALTAIYNTIPVEGTGEYNLTIQEADLSAPEQIFRITRYVVDSSGNLTQDDNGNLASIVHRFTGYYLAPDLQYETLINSNNKEVTYSYIFDSPNINTVAGSGGITDETGHKFPTYINLVLINPSYDLSRNGVYWLLQNRLADPAYNLSTLNPTSYLDQGIYPNQSGYAANFPNGPLTESYYYNQTFNYCSNAGPGCTGLSHPTQQSIAAGSTVAEGYFVAQSDKLNAGATGTVSNVPIDYGVQQIVYVPKLELLPSFSGVDSGGLWSYLINNYSINIANINSVITPTLTPYRTGINADISFATTCDVNIDLSSSPCTNFFTFLTSVAPTPQISSGTPYGDTQFINYSNYIQQIQIGVAAGDTPSSSFSSKSNPLVSNASNSSNV